MKKGLLSFKIIVFLAVITYIVGCSSGAKPVDNSNSVNTVDSSDRVNTSILQTTSLFYIGDGGKGKSLAILVPKATGLAENQGYLPTLVQGEFVSNFSGYSAISVLDRVRLDEQYTELLSGYYDDDAEAGMDFGRLTPTDYIMSGSITKISTGYALQSVSRRLLIN